MSSKFCIESALCWKFAVVGPSTLADFFYRARSPSAHCLPVCLLYVFIRPADGLSPAMQRADYWFLVILQINYHHSYVSTYNFFIGSWRLSPWNLDSWLCFFNVLWLQEAKYEVSALILSLFFLFFIDIQDTSHARFTGW